MPEGWTIPRRYTALAYSVAGASHVRAGVPNQDSKAIGRGDGVLRPLVLTVADGHGSAKCPRSDRGSRFAVECAVEACEGLIPVEVRPEDGEALLREKVIPAVVGAWRRAVEGDLRNEPLGGGAEAPPNYLAYGSTLLVCVVCQRALLFLQIGDGDMLLVDAVGGRSHALPEDATLMADVTTSLCQVDCEGKFRVRAMGRGADDPVLVQLSTDGYVNSFQNAAGFEQTGADHLALLREHGRKVLDDNMEQWLKEITTGGSGDDVSVAILVRDDQLGTGAGTARRVEVS